MDKLRHRIAMAGLILATAAGTLGAAANEGFRYERMGAAAPLPDEIESPRFDNFEQQAVAGSAAGTVRATVVPGLANGNQVEWLVDGLPAAPASTSLELPLEGIPPGPHQLQARIIDSTGNVGAISPSVSITSPE